MARSRSRQPISVPSNLPALALPALPDLKAVEDAFANIFKSLQGQQAAVLNIKAILSDKTALQERVALTREQENAQKELNKAMLDMARADPRGLRESVRLTLEQEKSQKELSKATDQERNRQRFGSILGGARNLLGIGVGKGNEVDKGPFAALGIAATEAAVGLVALRSVALASPGTFQRFQLALDDTTAVVGQALTPVLEIVTEGIRLFGDFLQTILPSTNDFREALSPISDFLNDLRGALASVAPIIRVVLVEGLKILGAALKGLLVPFQLLAAFLEGLFGEGEKLKTSVGAAVRNVSFQSAESFAKQVNVAAFRSGVGGGGKTPIEGISENVKAAAETLKEIGAWVRSIADKLGAAKTTVTNAGIKAAAGAVLPGSGPLVDAVNNLRQARGAGGGEAVNPHALPTTELVDKIRGKINEIVEGRSKAADPQTFFRDLLKMLRDQLKEGGASEKDIESELARAIEQGKRRGIDGTSGGR